jgi:hypothetical protein
MAASAMIVSPGMGMRAPVMTPAPMSMETPTTTYGEFLCVIPLRPPQATRTCALPSCLHHDRVLCNLSRRGIHEDQTAQ